MPTNRFIPISEPIEQVGHTPDPDNPEPWPPDLPRPERPFERLPEIPIPRDRAQLKFCGLTLKEGCYQLFLNDPYIVTFFQRRFEGTMRVELGRGRTIISGDLYRGLRFDDLVATQDRVAFGSPRPIIPIKPRKRYFAYWRVVGIETPIFTPVFLPCTMTLTVEEFQYTHPTAGQATGSFPQAPSRVLQIVLRKTTVPQGFSGPAFEGEVFQNGMRLSQRVTMLWVSDFFRRARLELENVTGVAIPGAVGADSFQSTYAKAGWDLTVVNGDANLAVPAGTGAAWSTAELHAFMVANRNPATNLDLEWRIYHVSLPLDFTPDAGIFGIMFDDIGDHREGACNFIQNFTGGNFDDDRSRLRSAIHEVGHGFNQLHPPTEGLASDNSIMSQSGDVRNDILNGGGTFPDDINFAFNDHNRHHLIHFPDVVVRPGGEDFKFGHLGLFAPEAQDRATERGFKLEIGAADLRLKLGQPLVLSLEIVNGGRETAAVPTKFGTAFHNVEIVVARPGASERHFRSFVMVCHAEEWQQVAPGKAVAWEEVVYWDSSGMIFPTPGLYRVTAEARWIDGDGAPLAVEASLDVWVDFPVSDRDNAVAAALLDPEVGKYVALGGNAVHLKAAVARIQQATKLAAGHAAVEQIAKLDALAIALKKQRTKARKRRGGRK